MPGFTCTHTIPFRGVDDDYRANLSCVMELMLEASLQHNEATPHPSSWFWANGFGFLLTHWQAAIDKYPRWNEQVTMRTWPAGSIGFVAYRSFEMLDKNGESLARANSGWAFVDMRKRAPARPPADLIAGYGPSMPDVMPKDFRLPGLEAFTEIGSRNKSVTKRDMDANRHVNSIAYLDWAMDSLTLHGLSQNGRAVEMKTAYRKECTIGAEVEILTYSDVWDCSRAMVQIRESEGEKALLCEVFMKLGEA